MTLPTKQAAMVDYENFVQASITSTRPIQHDMLESGAGDMRLPVVDKHRRRPSAKPLEVFPEPSHPTIGFKSVD